LEEITVRIYSLRVQVQTQKCVTLGDFIIRLNAKDKLILLTDNKKQIYT